MKFVPLILISVLWLFACGEPPAEEGSCTVPVDTLVAVDSIGVLMGDTCYMFGAIADFDPLPAGGAALLDRMTGRISIFSSDGTFERSFGRMGEGPGEFQYPVKLVCMPSDMYVVLEFLNGNVTLFDAGGVYMDRWEMDGMGTFPLYAYAFDDSSFVSYNFSMVMGESDFHIRYSLWRYNVMTGEVLAEYFTWNGAASPSTDFVPAYINSVSDGNGWLYLTRVENDSWMIEVFGPESTPLDTILAFPGRGRIPVESDTSSVPGVYIVRYAYYEDGDTGTGFMNTNAPDKHPLINGIAVGPDGYIWARRGGPETRIWDVISPEGVHKREVVLEHDDPETWITLHINPYGVLGLNSGAEDYHRIYFMEFR